jgi:hypothetical protein
MGVFMRAGVCEGCFDGDVVFGEKERIFGKKSLTGLWMGLYITSFDFRGRSSIG